MTYYDRLNAFFLDNEIEPLPPSAQLLYLHLLHENNRLQNPGRFRLSDSRLAAMTGLTRQTIANAKRALTNRELLEIVVDSPRKSTLYILPEIQKAPRVENDGRQIETTGAAISAELKRTWKMNNDGVSPDETETYYLAEDVKLYGEEKVRQAINRFRCHTVSVVNGEVQLKANDICRYERERRLRRKIDKAQIPPRYAGLTLDDYTIDAGNQNAVNWAKYVIKNPQQSLYIFGTSGTGKTFLAAILAQELMKAGKSVLFVDVPNLLDNLRKTFNKKGDDDTTLDEMMKALQAADVLILDDMGVENPTAWVAERVYVIINDRYNANKPVIVTSNFNLGGLINRFADEITGARIISRLQHMCKLAEISGTDKRLRRK